MRKWLGGMLLALLLGAVRVDAAITLVAQAQADTSGTSYAVCISGSNTSVQDGDLFVLALNDDNVVTSIADDSTNTWGRATNCLNPTHVQTGIWYIANAVVVKNKACDGSTANGTNHLKVTATQSVSSPFDGLLSEWHGVKTTAPLDQIATCGTGSGGAPTTQSVTPLQNNELVFAEFSDTASCGPTTPTGYTELTGSSVVGRTQAAYQIQTTAAAVSAAWSGCSGVNTWAATQVSFEAPSVAAGGQVMVGQ